MAITQDVKRKNCSTTLILVLQWQRPKKGEIDNPTKQTKCSIFIRLMQTLNVTF